VSTRTRWLVGAAVLVVAVIAGATVGRMTEQDEPMLVEVPCSEIPAASAHTEKCFDAEGSEGASKQEEVTLLCNSYSAKREEHLRDRGVPYCEDTPDIPEYQEWAAGIRPLS
jgi:hypothetical protein